VLLQIFPAYCRRRPGLFMGGALGIWPRLFAFVFLFYIYLACMYGRFLFWACIHILIFFFQGLGCLCLLRFDCLLWVVCDFLHIVQCRHRLCFAFIFVEERSYVWLCSWWSEPYFISFLLCFFWGLFISFFDILNLFITSFFLCCGGGFWLSGRCWCVFVGFDLSCGGWALGCRVWGWAELGWFESVSVDGCCFSDLVCRILLLRM